MGPEFGAGHFLSAPYFQSLDNPTNQKFVENFLKSKYRIPAPLPWSRSHRW
jgi:urea transport system substrate-binding protein